MYWTTAFDLDGTLINSHDAVYDAYVAAGVTPPDDFWGKSAQDWLYAACDCDMSKMQAVHTKKNQEYIKLIAQGMVPLLSAADALTKLQVTSRIVIVTAASTQAAHCILQHHDLRPDELFCFMSGTPRNDTLRLLQLDSQCRGVVMIDDNPSGNEPVSVVRYDKNMHADDVIQEVHRLWMS